jgi:hypothetical protein
VPVVPGQALRRLGVADPAEAHTLDEVRGIREAIQRRVERLLAELGVTVSA